VTALAFSGDLRFNPLEDELTGSDGQKFRFTAPIGEELPSQGYDLGEDTYQPPVKDAQQVQVAVSPQSDRLQLISPFSAWHGNDFHKTTILIKVAGKCTTDHIRYCTSSSTCLFTD
jgi:aconitate hydratase